MSEFTKGKWEYKQGDGNYWTIQSVKAEQVGDCINEANARLIAAAPEMYEMITKLVDGVTMAELLNGRQIIKVNPELVESAKQLLARIDGKEHEELHEVEAQA